MNARELRQKYLDFFDTKDHRRQPSDSLVPNDPSLLFTSAGMVQFKPYFLGAAKPPYPRLSSAQKCLRTTDIEEVGNPSHLTFFEMLGNFSIGDYFKREAITWAWEFLTDPKWLGLDSEKLCVSVYETDDEAAGLWREVAGFGDDRIHRLGEDKNFWPANAPSEGPNGPCGPCTEIFYRMVPADQLTGNVREDDKAGRWLEIWNLVLMQYARTSDPNDLTKDVVLTPLPKPSIDTGMGLDRTACALGGFPSVYHIDTMAPIMTRVGELSGIDPYRDERTTLAARIITDHIRSAAFCLVDGVLPQNTGRGYVLRRLIRRAVLKGQLVFGFEQPFLARVFPAVVEAVGDHYTELVECGKHVERWLQTEEEAFRRTLRDGAWHLVEAAAAAAVPVLEERTQEQFSLATSVEIRDMSSNKDRTGGPGKVLSMPVQVVTASSNSPSSPHRVVFDVTSPEEASKAMSQFGGYQVPGAQVFELHDTFGVPLEVTKELVEQLGGTVDIEGYNKALEEQRERSRAAGGLEERLFAESVTLFTAGDAQPFTPFVGYDNLQIETRIVQVSPRFETEDLAADEFDVALRETPFYAESGGEVGDTGTICCDEFELSVEDTQRSEGIVWHRCRVLRSKQPFTDVPREEQLRMLADGYLFRDVTATVDADRRRSITRNHTATHLLHAALRATLGDHVHQAGSLVAPEHLRFDFTHNQAMTPDKLATVERIVNEWVYRERPVAIQAGVPIADAKKRGAMALFGEKYGDTVRVVEVPGFSTELCGGCHVPNTANIGVFKITHESSVASGVRRIEALTGEGAYEWLVLRDRLIREAAGALKATPTELPNAIERLQSEMRDLRQQLERAVAGGAGQQSCKSLDVGGVPLLVQSLSGLPFSAAGQVADRLAEEHKGAVVLVGAEADGKVTFVAKVSPEAQAKGAHAGNLVREVAKVAGGSGGGRPDFAQAGAKDPSKLADALAAAADVLAAQFKK